MAVDIGKLGDCGDLPQEPHEIVALLIWLGEAPFGACGQAELRLDVGQKFADANRRGSGLFLLNLKGCVLGLIVVQPGVDGAVDQKNEADQSDQRGGQFRRQRNAQRPARRRFAGLGRRIKRYVRVRRADCAWYGHSITSSASPGSPRDRHANCAGETATDL